MGAGVGGLLELKTYVYRIDGYPIGILWLPNCDFMVLLLSVAVFGYLGTFWLNMVHPNLGFHATVLQRRVLGGWCLFRISC